MKVRLFANISMETKRISKDSLGAIKKSMQRKLKMTPLKQ